MPVDGPFPERLKMPTPGRETAHLAGAQVGHLGPASADPLEHVPVALPLVWLYLAGEILRDLVGLASRGVARNRDRVAYDYDLGVWQEALERRRWAQASTLADYLEGDDQKARVVMVNHRIARARLRDYYRYRNTFLGAVLEEWAPPGEELIELGCGGGYNLFALRLYGRWRALHGFDVSENALEVARHIAEHFQVTGLRFDHLDLTDGAHPNFRLLGGRTVFTHYVVEQLKYASRTVIDNLIRSGVKRAIHIEPGTDLMPRLSLHRAVNRLYILRQDYEGRLVRILREFEAQKALTILDVRRLGYAPNVKNDPVMVVWEPRASAGGASA
jgi:hypothetical protein